MRPDRFTADRVRAAAEVLAGVAVRTPLLSDPMLDDALGVRVVCKAENLQRTGSFKFRGAYHAIAALPSAQRSAGVVGASSGNHAQALALAARLLGTQATVVVPSDAPATKLEGVRHHGATVVTYNRATDDRDAVVAELAVRRGLSVVPSANAYDVMAGAGTVALEVLQDSADVDTVLVPIGGGGLAAGCATIAKDVRPSIRVIGVEPEGADDTAQSLRQARLVTIARPDTIADGLGHASPSPLPFEVNRRLLDRVVTVTDDEIAMAMWLCFRHLRIVVEPSGATALAALIAGGVGRIAGRIAVLVSGGNVDWARYQRLIGVK